MKTYTWNAGQISEGLSLTKDKRFGQVVYLGEAGRGRRYEKIALDRRFPAEVIEGKVLEAYARKITLPARDGKPEKIFFVLAKPRFKDREKRVLTRINTQWCYTKKTYGSWSTILGEPEDLIKGYGAHGAAGRIGNWDDGLVLMRPGDVLKVRPEGGHKVSSYALWIGEDGVPRTATWQDYENILALEKAQTQLDDAEANQNALETVFKSMPAYTWRRGGLESGISVRKGATGQTLTVGEEGRGREYSEMPLIGFNAGEKLENAAVVMLDKKEIPALYSWEKPTQKVIYGLTQSDEKENAFLVRVDTGWVYTRGTSGYAQTWKGNPTELMTGHSARGAAGRIGSASDSIFVLHEGDVLYIHPEGGYKTECFALFVEEGELKTSKWHHWKAEDGRKDPEFYIQKGLAPMGHIPEEWIGKVVTVQELTKGERRGASRSRIEYNTIEDRETGELISVKPPVLNLGWDGRDYHETTLYRGTWIKLETDKKVRRLDGPELEKRQTLRNRAEELRAQAFEATRQSFFPMVENSLRDEIQELAHIHTSDFDTMPTESDGWGGSLTQYVRNAEEVLGRLANVETEMKALETRQSSGEILMDFGGHFRTMGNTNNAEYWVIKPDASFREPDSVSYRKRYTSEGEKIWRKVEAEELAISWFKSNTAAAHEFIVNKMPVGGCSPEQLAKVAEIQGEIARSWDGRTGMSGKNSPPIGDGWNLGSVTDDEEDTAGEENSMEDAMAKLLAKFGDKNKR